MKIAFNTANLVGRVTDYRFALRQWGEQHRLTVEKTDEREWAAICAAIAAQGYTAVEVWAAHADPATMDEKRARRWLTILHDQGLAPIGWAGGLTDDAVARVCQWLGIQQVNGGFTDRETTQRLCETYDLYANHENHPEKSAEEILSRLDGGSERLGVCIDSGWLGTQGADAPAMIRALGSRVRHVHVKDVHAVGGHETCLLGTGVVDLTGMFAALKENGYGGWYSWEDEPEDRNPFDSAAQNRHWLTRTLGG